MRDEDRPYVVVGMDGSSGSVNAAEYAADWASGCGLDVHLVHGHTRALVPYLPTPVEPPASGAEMLRLTAEVLRARHRDLHVVCRQAVGNAAAVLVDESRWAALTVVGSRGRGGVTAALLGSVAAAVTAHAAGPVVVVHRPAPQPDRDAPVVVGVDGSAGGDQALAFAFSTAEQTRAEVVALHAWWADPVETLRNRGEYEPRTVEAAAGRLLATTVEPWRAKFPTVEVRETLVHSLNPALTLIDEASEAALLVVGPRGHGGFAGLMLGSVTSTVVQHGRCPVAVGRAHSHRAM